MRALVTRPHPEAADQARLLRERGITPILSPLLCIEPVTLPDIIARETVRYAGTVVTSQNALRSLEQQETPAALKTLPIFCVGPATAALATRMGFQQVLTGAGTASDLPDLIANHVAPMDGRLLRLTGQMRSKAPQMLDQSLRERGYGVETVPCYRVKATGDLTNEARDALAAGQVDLVILMSPATAKSYVMAVKAAGLTIRSDKPRYVCLSQAVADELVGFPQACNLIADKPNQTGLVSVIDRAVAHLS